MEKLKSPITKTTEVKKIADFSVKRIIENYLEIGIDTTKYFKDLKTLSLYKCLKTGFRFYYPFETLADEDFYNELSKNIKSYYPKCRWEHEQALKHIKDNDKVLEVGSGFGYFLEKVKNKTDNYLGLEINKNAVEEGLRKGLNIKYFPKENFLQELNETYDVICCFQVLEHIKDVNSFFCSSIKSLKNKGKFIIGVPYNNPYLYRKDKYHTLNLPPHHAGLWDKSSLKNLENIYGIKYLTSYIEPIDDVNYYWDIQISPLKRLSTFLYKGVKYISRLFKKPLFYLIKKIMKGRNIIVIFQKK